jgi:hypothetical protein
MLCWPGLLALGTTLQEPAALAGATVAAKEMATIQGAVSARRRVRLVSIAVPP